MCPLGVSVPWCRSCGSGEFSGTPPCSAFLLQDVPVEALTTVKPYCNEIHAQAQLWLKRDPKASYEAWKKCLPIRGGSVSSRLGKSIPPTPVLTALKSPHFCHFLVFTSPCTPLPARGRWQWEVPQQIRAPPSLSDGEVRVEVETVPESSGQEDLPLGPQTGP